MNPLLSDVQDVVERLQRMPGVTKIVPGSISKAPHDHKPGDVKFINAEKHCANVRVYSRRGM
jgi:hypothetical protein